MLTPEQDQFIEWLNTPKSERSPRSQEALASAIGVSPSQLARWKKDPDFLEGWNVTYLRSVGSPEIKMEIMATLRKTATDPDDPKHVQAAEKYFAIEGSLRPGNRTSLDITVGAAPVSDLTDEQLQRMLASKAGDELGRRRDSA